MKVKIIHEQLSNEEKSLNPDALDFLTYIMHVIH